MIPFFATAYAVKFSISLIKAHRTGGIKKKLKEKLKSFNTRNINIERVDGNAQMKLLDHIEQFVKHKTLVDLKHKTTFAFMKAMFYARQILLIGLIGVIAYKLYKLIKDFISFFIDLNKEFKLYDYFMQLQDAWKKCHNNVFIFLYCHWEKGLNVRNKIVELIDAIWNRSIDAIITTCDNLQKKVKEFIKGVYASMLEFFGKAAEDGTPFINVDQAIEGYEIRDPYDYTKAYKMSDPYAQDGQPLSEPTNEGVENKDLETDSDPPVNNEYGGEWSVDRLIKAASSIPDKIKPLGTEIVNLVKGIFESGDKAKQESSNEVKQKNEETKKRRRYKSRVYAQRRRNKTSNKKFDENKAMTFDFKLLAINDLYHNKYKSTAEFKQQINSVFLDDAVQLKKVKFILKKLTSTTDETMLNQFKEHAEIEQLKIDYMSI